MIFRQLFDPRSSTYTYLLADQGQAVLIDPVFEHARRDGALLRELGLQLVATLETHVHADHVTGAWLHKQQQGSDIALGARSGASGADRLLEPGQQVAFGSRHLQVRSTPGHTAGCITYVLDDHSMAFTGDALLVRGAGRTDFQEGDATTLFRSVHEQILSLPDSCTLWPGHDYQGRTATSVAEERRHNPRLGGDRSESDFVGYMTHLGLPHPRLIDEAVPANLRVGRRADGQAPAAPDWAPLTWTYAGVWELPPEALQEVLDRVTVVDVREAEEFTGPLGHIEGARSLPLGTLEAAIPDLDTTRPIVTVCRSGGRSTQAVVLLGKAGFERVANLAGGMLQWNALALPVQDVAPPTHP